MEAGMLVVRNACEDDLDTLLELAAGIGPGMTTFKPGRAAMTQRLALAAASFEGRIQPHEADYLFVLEDLAKKRVCGVAAIKGAVGVNEPFYNYRISTSVHTSPSNGLVNRVQSLHLTHDLSGATELCSLYLHPDYRKGIGGRLLSKSRFMFLAQFPMLFSDNVIAEMRGYQDASGRSPFWESVGRPFFHMDFHEADDRCGMGDRLFIEQLVPRLPLYKHLLGEPARAAIARTHDDTVPARRLLEQEGMHFDGYVDIFDGGPVLEANLSTLRASRDSRLQVIGAGSEDGPEPSLVATTNRERFRVIVAGCHPGATTVRLVRPALGALGGEHGMPVRVLPVQPHPSPQRGS
jgi:arginine N-succinyltransferase